MCVVGKQDKAVLTRWSCLRPRRKWCGEVPAVAVVLMCVQPNLLWLEGVQEALVAVPAIHVQVLCPQVLFDELLCLFAVIVWQGKTKDVVM